MSQVHYIASWEVWVIFFSLDCTFLERVTDLERQKLFVHTAQFSSHSKAKSWPPLYRPHSGKGLENRCWQLRANCKLRVFGKLFLSVCLSKDAFQGNLLYKNVSLYFARLVGPWNKNKCPAPLWSLPSHSIQRNLFLNTFCTAQLGSPSVSVSPVQTGPLAWAYNICTVEWGPLLPSSTWWLCHFLSNTKLQPCLQTSLSEEDNSSRTGKSWIPTS